MEIKYPKNIATAGRQNVVLALTTSLDPLDANDLNNGTSPMLLLKPYAGVGFNFSDSAKNKGGNGNIEAERIPDVKVRTQEMMGKIMEEERKQASRSGAAGEAELEVGTRILFLPEDMKEGKGKTAMEIAEMFGSAKAFNAAENLRASAQRNPKYAKNNNKQADAMYTAAVVVQARETVVQAIPAADLKQDQTIADIFSGDLNKGIQIGRILYNTKHPATKAAVDLHKLIQAKPSVQALLKREKTVSENMVPYKIYGPVIKTPNVKKLDSEGFTRMYELRVECYPQDIEHPFRVQLKVTRGKPIQGRMVGAVEDRNTPPDYFKMDLTSWEWNNMIDRADWEKKLVEMAVHAEMTAAMRKADHDNYMRRQQAAVPQASAPAVSGMAPGMVPGGYY